MTFSGATFGYTPGVTKLRTAKATPTCYEVTCPYCGEAVEEPGTGSLTLWGVNEGYDKVQHCYSCDQDLLLPKKLQAGTV